MRTLALALLAAGFAAPQDVDREIDRRLRADGLTAAAPADDHEFFRRIHLDLLGRLPKPDEIRAFVKQPDRAAAIDRLLESPEAARYWADRWVRLLLTYDFRETDPFVIDFGALHAWLEKTWTDNLPYDRFVTAIVAAEGDKYEHPQTNYLVKFTDPKTPPVEVTSRVTRLFLGRQIQCAQCHDHPYEEVTQKDYWGMAAFFGNLRARTRKTFDGIKTKLMQEEPVEAQVFTVDPQDWKATPRFLDGRVPEKDEKPRKALARFLVSAPGRQFAKAFVNREWGRLMGRGFVEPVDRFTAESKPSHPELLEGLARDFEENGYDVRRLLRAVLNSKAYQRSSRSVKGASREHFALDFDVFFQTLFDQFRQNKDLPDSYKNIIVFRVYLQQFISALLSPGGVSPEEQDYSGSVQLALKLMNNKDLQGTVRAHWGHLKRTLEKLESPAERLEEIFLTLLSRPPTPEEEKRYLDHIRRKRGDATAYEDVYWVLLNSPEFFFNH
jgi:hypothetical protein